MALTKVSDALLASTTFAPTAHTHTIANVTSLQTSLDAKAPLASPSFTGNVTVAGTVDGVDVSVRDAILTSTTTTASAALPKSGGAMTGAITSNSNITLTGSGKFTGDGSSLSGVDPFPAGTVMIFRQTSAPTGWTKKTDHDNKALRVVSGAVSSGGTHDLSSPPSTSHTHTSAAHGHGMSGSIGQTTLTIAQMPNHSHTMTGNVWRNLGDPYTHLYVGAPGSGSGTTSNTGGGGSHNHGHGLSVSSSTPPATGSTAPTAFSPKFIDIIVAEKD